MRPPTATCQTIGRAILVTALIERAARGTNAIDGPASTLITAADLVSLVGEFVQVDDPDDALFEAAETLDAYHYHITVSDEEAAALNAAEAAATERLVTATSLDDLADAIAVDYSIGRDKAEQIVENISWAAAHEGSLHVARLRESQRMSVHHWFVAHVAKVQVRGRLSPAMTVHAAKSHARISAQFALQAAEVF